MSGAATTASVLAVLVVAALFGMVLGIWLPALTAVVLTLVLAVEETRRGWRRWRAMRSWAARLSV